MKWQGTVQYGVSDSGRRPELQVLTVEAETKDIALRRLLDHPDRRPYGAVLYETIREVQTPS